MHSPKSVGASQRILASSISDEGNFWHCTDGLVTGLVWRSKPRYCLFCLLICLIFGFLDFLGIHVFTLALDRWLPVSSLINGPASVLAPSMGCLGVVLHASLLFFSLFFFLGFSHLVLGFSKTKKGPWTGYLGLGWVG